MCSTVLLTYRGETKQPWCPIAGLPLLEFSPALESWSEIYRGPTSCLIVQQMFFSLKFLSAISIFLSSGRLFTERSLLQSWVDLDAPYCWLATSLFWYSCLLSFLKRFWKIAYPAFNIGIIWVLGINVLDIVWRPNTHMTVSKMLLLSQVGPSLFSPPLILLSTWKATQHIYITVEV